MRSNRLNKLNSIFTNSLESRIDLSNEGGPEERVLDERRTKATNDRLAGRKGIFQKISVCIQLFYFILCYKFNVHVS